MHINLTPKQVSATAAPSVERTTATPRLPASPEVIAARRAICAPCNRNIKGKCVLCPTCGTTGSVEVKIAAALEQCPEFKWLRWVPLKSS